MDARFVFYMLLLAACVLIDILIIVQVVKYIIFYCSGKCHKEIFEKDGKKYIRIYGTPRFSSWGEVFIYEIKDEEQTTKENNNVKSVCDKSIDETINENDNELNNK